MSNSSIKNGTKRLFAAVLCALPCLVSATHAVEGEAEAKPAAAAGSATSAASGATPIVFVAFDELPLVSLLDASGAIDAARYPAFAELARQSTWARHATSVASRTLDAVPALLTGRYPGTKRRHPIHAQHPESLFRLLAPNFDLNVIETESLLMPDRGYTPRGETRQAREPDPQIARIKEMRKDNRRPLDGPSVLRRFSRSIARHHARAAAGRGSLHFAHVLFPANPWRFTPSGMSYEPSQINGTKGNRWGREAWWVEEAWRRHLLQVEFADRLLGEILERLRRDGLFDDSLVVVASTYGVSFWPDESRYSPLATRHPEDIMNVPLFIKRPGQREAERIERTVETIDIVPSIADILGIEIPWPVDGCSIFDSRCPEREQRQFLVQDERTVRRLMGFPPDVALRTETRVRKIELFGSGVRHEPFYHFGPFAALAGRAVSELRRRPAEAGEVELSRRGARWLEGESSVRVVGILRLDPPGTGASSKAGDEVTPHVAVALDGRIETIVPVLLDRRKRRLVSAILPEASLQGGANELALYLVLEPEGARATDAPRLAPLRLK